MSAPDIVVVGAGHAAIQLAASLRQGRYEGGITLINDEAGLPYQRPPLSKAYLGGHMDEAALALRPAGFYAAQNVGLIEHDAAVAIDRGRRRVMLASGARVPYGHLVLATGAATLAGALDHLVRDHSPLDWARAQVSLARVLTALGEAAADERAFEKAVTCYDRAHLVLREAPASPLRGLAAGERAVCLARSAELTGDLSVLQAAETALKIELAGQRPRLDPVAWALAQLHLARLYEARLDITGKDRGERASALMALEAALDVFADQGMRSLTIMASDALERLRAGPASRRAGV